MQKIRQNTALLGYLFAIGATVIWSGNFIIARGLNESIHPVALAFFRWLVAVAVSLPFTLKTALAEKDILKKHIPYLAVTAFFGVTLFNTLVYIAGQTTTALNLSLISLTFPIFTVIILWAFLGEKMTFQKIIGTLLVLIGVTLLVTKGEISKLASITFAIGDLWMLVAALSFAIYSILVKRKPSEISGWSFQASTFILGFLILVPFYFWEKALYPPTAFDAKTIGGILYIGIFAAFIAFALWNRAVMNIGPAKASMIYYTVPLFSGVLAYIFLGEAVTIIHLVSAVLIFSGIFTANRA